jgi:hypothetical protein
MIPILCEECRRPTGPRGGALCDDCLGIPVALVRRPKPKPVHRPIVECVTCQAPFRAGDSPLPDQCPPCAAASGLLVEGIT